MSKAVQAAGRVIRSETDKGIIILMDGRFIESTFSQAMPKDWYDASPKELISGSILAEISEFWANA
jgi:DNA excision repair protein ERCC-2